MSSLLDTFARIRFAAADVGERRTWSDGGEREKQGDGTWAKVDGEGGSGASGASNSVGGGYKETSKEVPGRDLSAMSMVDENAEWESQVEGKMGEAEGMGITGQDAQAWAEAVLSGDQGAADSIASQYGGGDPFGDDQFLLGVAEGENGGGGDYTPGPEDMATINRAQQDAAAEDSMAAGENDYLESQFLSGVAEGENDGLDDNDDPFAEPFDDDIEGSEMARKLGYPG